MEPLATHTGTFSIADRIAAAWHYLPVEVPAGTSALRVTLSYPRESGAVLDLGVFGPEGFRGWSGGARDSFVLSELGATPGYLAGPVTPGLWQVVIGLYLVPESGIPFTVTAQVTSAAGAPLHRDLAAGSVVAAASGGVLVADAAAGDGAGPAFAPLPPAPAARPGRRSLPAPAGFTWLAGDLHAHTLHSDGVMSVPELACFAVERGLDFLAVTDHNTVSHHASLAAASARYGVTLVPGQEVTTAFGHAGVLGDTGWIDFREPAGSWLSAAETRGGLMSVNHPFAAHVSWLHPMPRRPPLLEVWHWSWLDLTWTTPLSWWQAWDPSAIPVGGSDWHRPGSDAPLGTPTTWVLGQDSSVSAVLDGLRGGRVAISAGRDGPLLLREADSFVAVDADGLVLIGPAGPSGRISGDLMRLPGAPGYHRLLTPGGATMALTPLPRRQVADPRRRYVDGAQRPAILLPRRQGADPRPCYFAVR